MDKNIPIKIKNFGSIKEAKLDIKSLTVFIGPNNSGKSYASLLFHSLTSSNIKNNISLSKSSIFFDSEYKKIEKLRKFFKKKIFEEISTYVEKEQNKEFNHFILSSNLLDEIFYKLIELLITPYLKSNISSLFGKNLDKLVNNNAVEFSINYQEVIFTFSNETFKSLINNVNLPNFNTMLNGRKILRFRDGKLCINMTHPFFDNRNKSFQDDSLVDMVLNLILSIIREDLFKNHSYYMPTAKGDLSNYLKFFTGQNFTITNEDFPYTAGSLAKDLINMNYDEKSIFYDIARNLENELFTGKTKVDTSNELPKYSFLRNDGLELNNKHISSSIAEIRPIILFLKHELKKDDTIIIEEPESHLNPKNQRIFIKYLIRCINAGLRVLITTHSDYIIDQINNHIMLNNIKNEKLQMELRKKHEYLKEDFLDSNLVSVHAFRENNDFTFTSHKIEITELGIQAEDMNEIASDLYDESYDIKDYLMR